MQKDKVLQFLITSALVLVVFDRGAADAKPNAKKPQRDQLEMVAEIFGPARCDGSIVSAKKSSFSPEEWKWLTTTASFIYGGPFEFDAQESTLEIGTKSSTPLTLKEISPLLGRAEYRKWLGEDILKKLQTYSERRQAIESLAEKKRFKSMPSQKVFDDSSFTTYFSSQSEVSKLFFKKFNLIKTESPNINDCD